MSCSRSARRRTSTRCDSTTGSAAISTASSVRFISSHAFANLDTARSGDSVRRELIPEPTPVREGAGWSELELGRHPDLFFVVHRLDFDDSVEDDTAGRFHVLNLVGGDEIEIESGSGVVHGLSYAETIVVPAAVGRYRLRRLRGGACKVVKAFVP